MPQVEFMPAFNDVSAAYQVANRKSEYQGVPWLDAFDEAMRSFGYAHKGGPCTCEGDYEYGDYGHRAECGWYLA